jgi:uncharacterized protein (DUF1015 family)
MPRFEPFTGVHYASDIDIAAVAAPPYDVISPADRAGLARRDVHNIVHIDVPDPELGDARYSNAALLMQQWLADGVLVRDPDPSFYLYRMNFTDEVGHDRHVVGVIGGLEVVPVGEGDVLPHEETTPKDKTDRLDLTNATRANLSPVWGLSLASRLTDLLAARGELIGEVTVDGVTHRCERVTEADRTRAISSAVAGARVVIADGHHRYEVARRYRAESGLAGAELTMTLVMELAEDQLAVQAIHRLVSDVDEPSFLAVIDDWFVRTPAGAVDARYAGEVVSHRALCLVHQDGNGEWLTPRPDKFLGTQDLDSARIRVALAGLAHTIAYQHGVDHVLDALSDRHAQFGILIRPVSVAAIRQLAADRSLMPPKSTFFVPKPRTGLVIRPMD